MSDYRLAPVREVRSLDERTKKGQLADASNRARDATTIVDEAHDKVVALEGKIAATREHAATTVHELVQRDRYLVVLRTRLDDARLAEARARAALASSASEVDAARVRLAHARAAKEVVERHFATWRDTQRKIAERREE